jgi:hypothetical protein
MSSMLVNWKTTLSGTVLILVGGIELALNLHIPGFSMEPGVAITMGLGLLMAKDAKAP